MTRDQYITLFDQGLEDTLFRGLTRYSARAGAAALVDTLASVGVIKLDPVARERCAPPKEHEDVRYHWLTHAKRPPMIARWERANGGGWVLSGESMQFPPEHLHTCGWRYHRPIHNP